MRVMRRRSAAASGAGRGHWVAATFLAFAWLATLAATPARAAIGYELDAVSPSRSLDGKVPHSIAVDQASRRIYVAITLANSSGTTAIPGEIARFESDLSAAGVFAPEGGYYTGVAVNPLTQGFYAARATLHTPLGAFGTSGMDTFSAAGTAGTSFAVSDTGAFPQIATDSNGDVYYPNAASGKVQVFNPSGILQEEIGCGGCPGGSFGDPVSVALNSEDHLYVVDLAPDRVVKLTPSGGSYSFASTLQSGRGAAGIGVDPGTDDVFVGDLPNGANYHIVAYDSAGVQYDDFGAGLFTNPDPFFGALAAPQIGVDATNQKLYVGDVGKFYVFEKTTIDPPASTINPATPVGQLTATLRATVNANGHAVLECEFEYTDEADFQANGFANADTAPCSKAPNGSSNTAIDAKVSGLSPVTDYRYRVTATSNAGSVTSGAATFETLPVVPPDVTVESPLGVTQTGATLQATVNPRGGTVSDCHFEFGTSVSYGTNLSCVPMPGPVSSDIVEKRGVSKLEPGTTYHYRLILTTNAGTTEGEDVEFKTTSPPPPPPPSDPPPSEQPPVVVPPSVETPPAPLPRCGRGFRLKRIAGRTRCVRICRKGFKAKKTAGKVRCVRQQPRRTRAARR